MFQAMEDLEGTPHTKAKTPGGGTILAGGLFHGGVLLWLVTARIATAQDLTDATYARWSDFLRPASSELEYMEIPWRPSFWDAVIEAQLLAVQSTT